MNYSEAELKKILDTAVAYGGDFAEIYIADNFNGTIFAEEGKINRFYRGFDAGAGIRVMKGDICYYSYTNDLAYSSLLELAKRAGEGFGDERISLGYDLKAPKRYGKAGESWEAEKIGELIRTVNEYAWDIDERVKQVSLSYGDGRCEKLIASTAGNYVRGKSCRKRFFVQIIAESNGEPQSAVESLGDTEAVFQWTEEILQAKVLKAAKRALKQLTAEDAPSGALPVVMSSEAGGTMVHEACGHGLEGDSVSKGLSVYKEKLGQKVASAKVTVIDDATLPGKYGSFSYDDEGNPGRKNVLIENGILKQYLYDFRSARRVGTESTGNGRRQGYKKIPLVRMTNTYIAPGNDNPKDILNDIKKGFFVRKMGGGQVNTTNGDFVFEVSEGYLIENGECTVPVKNASLIGNGPKALEAVFAVGDDLGFAIGTCGKGGQSAAVSDAQPTLGISELTIGGRK